MPKFAFTAVALDGQTVKGTYKADTRSAAEVVLYERQLRDIQVTEKKSILQTEISGPRVTRDDLMQISRQMAAFVGAGLPILTAVNAIGTESANSSVRRVMNDIEDGLRAGETFSDCLDQHPKIFPDFYRGIVRSAELTGELDTVLMRLALYIERDLEARRKIKAATIYPLFVAIMSMVTVVVLSVFVLPQFEDFFATLDAKLPLPTRILLSITDFFGNWWMVMLVTIAVLVLAVVLALRTERGRYAKDRLLLGTPVLGGTIQYAMVERFCRILASMLSAGVALPEGLRVATGSLRNRVYMRSLSEVSESILEGQGISGPLSRTSMFPAPALQMLRVGEETGTLDTQLKITAEYYETELDYKIRKLTALFEPLVIIVMGLVVGFVAIALVSAMYGVFQQVEV